MARHAYEEAAKAEVAKTPGVSVSFHRRGRHKSAVLTCGDWTRFVTYSGSPSDSQRGVRNFIANLRGEIRKATDG